MKFTFTINIYEKDLTTSISVDSLVETLKLDESLDSAFMTIPLLTRKEPFNRGSRVNISVSDGTYTRDLDWIIYSRDVKIGSKKPGSINYNHTIGLIEPTIWAEKFITGTLTDTQPLGGTQRTLENVVDRILALSPFVRYDKVSSTRFVTLDSSTRTDFSNTLSPQLYLDKKNLREQLINVFKVKNAIPRIRWNSGWELVADYVDQAKLNIDISDNIIDYSATSDLSNFGNTLDSFPENVVPNEDETKPNVFGNSITDVIYVNSDDKIVGDSNFKIFTSYPLEKFISIKAKAVVNAYPTEEKELDLTQYFYEKKDYDTLEYTNANPYNFGARACSAYWSYRKNELDGLNETFNIFGTTLALENILDHAIDDQYSSTKNIGWEWEDVVFYIEYIPYIKQMRVQQFREDVEPYELTSDLLDKYVAFQVNQAERLNNLFDYTSNLYGQIQRLGIDTVSVIKKHYNLGAYSVSNPSGIYSLGDYTDEGYFVTKIELVYFTNFVIGRYELSKNWNRIAQFIQIDKQFRPYEIALTGNDLSLKRDIAMPFITIEVSGASDTNHGVDLDSNYTTFVTKFMNTFKNMTDTIPVSTAVFQVGGISGTIWTYVNGVLKPLQLCPEKNVIKYRVEFLDTKVAGYKLENELVGLIIYKKKTIVPYTEDDGTAELYKITLYDSYWDFQDGTVYSTNTSRMGELIRLASKFPEVETDKNVWAQDPISDGLKAANIFDTENDFLNAVPSIGVIGEYYVGLDTLRLWIYNGSGGTNGYDIVSANVFAIKNDPVYTLPYYQVFKDRSEILGFEMAIPIVPNKNYFENIIIGDHLVKDNNMLVNRDTGRDLYFATSTTRYSKSNTDNIGTSGITASKVSTIVTNTISVPSAIRDSDYYSIIDSSGNLYLAVNQRNLDGTKTDIIALYFNFLSERN